MMKRLVFISVIFLLIAELANAQCDVPVNLASNPYITANGINNVDLSWDAVSGAVNYTVTYRIVGSGDNFSGSNVTTNSLTLANLPPSTEYEWKVRAVCSSDWTIYSDFTSLNYFTTLGGSQCVTIIDLSATNFTTSSVDLTWTPTTTAIQYYVQYRDVSTQPWSQADYLFTYQEGFKTIDNLVENKVYESRIRTICSADWSSISDYSNIVQYNTYDCNPPDNLISSPDIYTADLSWDPVALAEAYEVKYRIANTTDPFIARTTSSTNYLLTNLEPDTEYEWIVASICNVEYNVKSGYTTGENFTTLDGTSCDVPGNLISVPGTYDVILSWDPVSIGIKYEIKIALAGTTEYIKTDSTTSTSVTFSNLQPDTDYDWIIRTICSDQPRIVSDWLSPPESFTTLPGDICTAPENLFSIPDIYSVDLSWDPVSAALSYEIKYRVRNSSSSYLSKSTVDPNYTVNNLDPDTEYEWMVRSVCAADGSSKSPFTSLNYFTTLPGPSCDTPTNLNSVPDAFSSDLSWDAMTGAVRYQIKYKRTNSSDPYISKISLTNSYTLQNLDPNTSYSWIIRTDCSGDYSFASSWSSEQQFITLDGDLCSIPTNLTSVPSSTSSVLSWDIVPGALQYHVKYGLEGGAYTKQFYTTDLSATISNLLPSSDYKWIIRSICSADESVYSPWAADQFFTTTAGAGRIASSFENISLDYSSELLGTNLYIDVYPIPAKDFLNIRNNGNSKDPIDIKIFNFNGQTLLEKKMRITGELQLDVYDYPQGTYILYLHRGNVSLKKKFIIMR